MPSSPYVVFGIVYNSFGNNISNSLITFSTSQGQTSDKTDSDGKYLVDLANAGYSSGETVTYTCYDKFRNESYSGTFTVSGANKELDIYLSAITDFVAPISNRAVQLFSISGKAINRDNPLQVQVSKLPSNFDSCVITYDSSNNPIKVVKTFGSDIYTRNITFDSLNNPTIMSKWVKS